MNIFGWLGINNAKLQEKDRTATAAQSSTVHASAVHVSVDELIALRLQVRGLKLSHGHPAASVPAGGHGSRFRGRGMDYQESRAYQPGDDIRNMDWRITARAGHPYVKLYQEERERPVVLLLDLNPGMFFGTRGAFKSVIGARIAALIGWAATTGGDRVGALLFNGGHREIQPRGGRPGALRLIRSLVQATDPERGMRVTPHPEALNGALQRLRRVARPGSLVFVVSDFYAIDDETRKHLLRLRRHADAVAVQVVDPLELAAPPPGRYGITDGSEQGILETRARREQAAYSQWFASHHEQVRRLMQRVAIPLLQISTTDDVASVLRAFLANPHWANPRSNGKDADTSEAA